MEVIVKPSFERDIKGLNRDLLTILEDKLIQISKAKTISNIIGLKLLTGYTHHYRIKVITPKFSYRIGAIIRSEKIWLVRFLPRRKIYREFP